MALLNSQPPSRVRLRMSRVANRDIEPDTDPIRLVLERCLVAYQSLTPAERFNRAATSCGFDCSALRAVHDPGQRQVVERGCQFSDLLAAGR